MIRTIQAIFFAASLAACAAPTRADVVISELMYHPLPDDDRTEFIEIHNTGAEVVALQGWCVRGVLICFPAGATIEPGGYLVLASDPTLFLLTYGFEPDHDYDGRLDNGGELIELTDAQGGVWQ